MKLFKIILVVFISVSILSCKNKNQKSDLVKNEINVENSETVKIIAISHGTLILETATEVIYVDPTGGAKAFEGQQPPTMVLITDIHGDHLSTKTLEELNLEGITVITPKAVSDAIPSTIVTSPKVLKNGETIIQNGISIEAIPMYNLREEALKFHTKGRGNGYVLTINNERIYISGDTEDIPEMRSLEAIDIAFVCMNLPYTMTVESAASAVLEFKPKRVYPYHYRGTEGLSDINLFKTSVNKGDASIEVVFLDWY